MLYMSWFSPLLSGELSAERNDLFHFFDRVIHFFFRCVDAEADPDRGL